MSTQKRVVGIALITAAAVIGDSMLFIVLPLYWESFGLTALWQIGLLLSINRFIRLPINPLVGLFYKHYSLRTGVFIAVVLALMTTMSYGVLQHFWLLLIMRALWGVAWSLLRLGGLLTVIDVTTEKNRGNYVGLYNGLWGIGGLIGMLAGGFLVEQTSIFIVTSLFAVIGFATIPAVWLLIPVTKREKHMKKTDGVNEVKWLSSYLVMILVTGAAVGFIVFGLFASTLSPLIERAFPGEWTLFHLTIGAATLAGMIQAIRWGWEPFLAPVVGKILDSAGSKFNVLYIPLFGGGLLLILLGTIQAISLLIGILLLFQIVTTIFVTTTDTLATRAASQSDSVKVMTAHTVVVDVGAAIGPFTSFLFLENYSLTVVYIISGALLLLLGMVWLGFNRYSLGARLENEPSS